MNRLLVLLLLVISNSVHAQVYKCVKNNNVSYSDKPCDGIANRNTLNSPSDLKEGISAYELGNYDLAQKKLTPLSVEGDAMAQNILGRMYMEGSGVPQDFRKALTLFQKAASKGLANAQSNLGVMYASGSGVNQDYKLSITWFKKAADQGFKIAMLNLADMYENGLGTYPDQVEATKWRNKANGVEVAKKNDLVNVETVGNSDYQEGLKHYYNFEFSEAYKFFLKAAKSGNSEAQLRLALMYRQGQGIQKNVDQAQYWAKKAEEGKHNLNDNRDRVLIYDSSASQPSIPTPKAAPSQSPSTPAIPEPGMPYTK